MFYDRFEKLCSLKGISKQKVCIDCGFSRTAWNRWKTGAIPNGDRLQRIADYFSVTADYLLTGEEKKSIPEDERNQQPELDDEQLKVAYFRGADPSLTKEDLDAMWEDAKNFRDFILEKKRREKHGE